MYTDDTESPAAREFVTTESAAAIALLAATVVALVWANSPWRSSYHDLWHAGAIDLRAVINDGLMTLFFFVVGLEIKRELVVGELRDVRTAALPAVAAAGGMLVPALLYLALNIGTVGAPGWGVPMATDIAFAVGVLALVGRRVPRGLRLFLLTLAIVDDLGSIVVIAVAYSSQLSPVRLLGLAGAALGLLMPARPRPGANKSVAERLEHRLHPWTSFAVVPLFALANAGVRLDASTFEHAPTRSVALGVVLGRVVGKVVGIFAATWCAVRLGWGRLPPGARWSHLAGVAALSGMGLTVSVLVANLAFASRPDLASAATTGVLAASAIAATLGALILVAASRPKL